MTTKRARRLSFVEFCVDVLRLPLNVPWRVLLAVTIDGVQPKDLPPLEREVARALLGDVEEIDPRIRRILVWRLGRASGKTTFASALAIWVMWTTPLPREGHGHIPCAFVVAPTRPVAKIGVAVARDHVRGTDLERYVVGDTTDGFTLRRPDGRVVEFRSVAASRGGANLRGRDVLVLILDESEFFASSEEGSGDYSVTDKDQISAVMPRLIGFVLCISTPWPTENATAEFFDRNHGHPVDAVAALGRSLYMRPLAQLREDYERELLRDEENARREYDCEAGARGGRHIFVEGLAEAVVQERALVVYAPAGARVGCGGDLALERDSSAIAFVSLEKGVYELLEFDEVRPTKTAPLAPGYVIRDRFAPLMDDHGVRSIMMDAHYRQSAIEHLSALGLRFLEAPDGQQGKYVTYMHFRAQLRAGSLRLPDSPRLLSQLRAVTATPMPGGGTRISSPRRAGGGHGDIVSAVVLAVYRASRARAREDSGQGEEGTQAPPITTTPSVTDGWVGSLSGSAMGGAWASGLLDSVRRGEKPE